MFRPDLRREAALAGAALTTLTRLPLPPLPPLPADWLARSARYFPAVGLLVGAVSAAVFWAAAALWPAPVPALLAVAVGLGLTGALHEDGLADCADGLGARSRERRLAIMKDPRLGTFGALALGLALALRVAALSAMPVGSATAALLGAAALSRFCALPVMALTPYAGDPDLAKLPHGIEGPRPAEMAFGAVFAVAPLLALELGPALSGLAAATLAAALVGWRLCRGLGGHTGDVLGAVVACAEVAFLLGAAAALR